MISVSTDFRRTVAKNTTFRIKAVLVFANGENIALTGEDFMMSGNTFERATSSVGSFDVGAAIIGKATLTLNNFNDKFSDYNFRNAVISVQIGVPISTSDDGTEVVEWVDMGVYNVEQPDSYANTIQLKCYDNLSLLEKSYSGVNTTYPATLATIAADACSYCGVSLFTTTFPNSSYAVAKRPEDDMTCLDVIAYVAQIAGCYAKADTLGRVCLQWYDISALDALNSTDGGLFTEPRDSADGGLFTDAQYEVAYNGGVFGDRSLSIITQHSQLTVATDDVSITGISVTASDRQTDDDYQNGETFLAGSAGYVISIADNPFILFGQAETVARQIAAIVVGLTVRPFSSSTLCDPSLEAGDAVLIVDGKQNQYPTIVTSQVIDLNGWATLSCDAEKNVERTTSSAGAVSRAVQEVKNAVVAEVIARASDIAELSQQLSGASGLYMTEDVQPDGSTIYYMHDKPELADSTIVWKLTANALGVSTDGGVTYPYGLDASGVAILNRIYAIGLNADYINAGTISGPTGTSTWNLTTGELVISGDSSVAGTQASQVASGAVAASNYLTFNSNTGLDVGYSGTEAKTRVKDNGVEIFDGNGASALFAGVQDELSVVRVGDASSGNVVMKSDGSVDIRTVWSTLGQSSLSAHFGYGETINAYGALADAPYYDLGQRNDDPSAGGIGAYSLAEGIACTASNYCSHAEGDYSRALGLASHAEGAGTRAGGDYSHSEGTAAVASGVASHAEGNGTIAAGANSHAMGTYNVSDTGRIWQVGNGTLSARKDIAYLTTAGAMWIAGSLTQNSDRRLKEHVDYLGEEAVEFVRNLHPALYIKDGERHVGFYAQDVAEADLWETVTVQEQHTDEGLGFDPLTLDYTALIAPLVAYCQQLERRIAELEAR